MSFVPRFSISQSINAAQMRISASQMVTIPVSWWLDSDEYSIVLVYILDGFMRLDFESEKKGRSIVSF